MAAGSYLRGRHRLVWLLLAAALFVRAVFPAGYMAERIGNGAIVVTICHSDATWRIPLKKEGKAADSDQPPCAFSSLAAAALLTPDLPELPLRPSTVAAFERKHRAFAFVQHWRQAPPARAPPATV